MTDVNNPAGGGDTGAEEKKPVAENKPANPAPDAVNQQPKTALDDDGGDAPQGDKPADAGWREKMAGGDEKFLSLLKRYGTEADFGKSYRELEKKAGQVKKSLPDNPTPEQLSAWRKENGIPESHDKYEIKLPEGMKLSDEDRPVVDEFLKTMHDGNVPPQIVNSALGWYMQKQEAERANMIEAEKSQRLEAIEKLRTELGPEYKATQGMIQAWLGRQGDVGEHLLNARGPDGKALFNNPDFVLWLNNHIRQTDPSATVVYDADMAGSSVGDEIAKIQDIIKNDPMKYQNDPKMQERFRKLSAAKRSAA